MNPTELPPASPKRPGEDLSWVTPVSGSHPVVVREQRPVYVDFLWNLTCPEGMDLTH